GLGVTMIPAAGPPCRPVPAAAPPCRHRSVLP
ncbi:hypothetical protein A2U01_0088339, partial [Trifolium medium]|nr:hypothetical protein [Trifolium medium]